MIGLKVTRTVSVKYKDGDVSIHGPFLDSDEQADFLHMKLNENPDIKSVSVITTTHTG